MDMGLQDRVVVVVGASSGLGLAVAEAFRGEGARVCEADLKAKDNDPLSRKTDIADDEAVRETFDYFGEKCGGIDHVVCAAAAGSGKFGFPFWNLDPSDWKGVLDVSLMGSIHVAHAAQPWLCRSQSEGRTLLFFTSVAGQMGSQTDPPYSAAKAAVINFTQCAAKDFAPFGVRVNALSPGMVKTSLNESVWAAGQELLPDEKREDYETWSRKKIREIAPLSRWQEPGEFGAMAVYLASPHAANITGQIINIDGGQIMRG